MSNTISPNMNLVIPGVATEVGPTWALDLNASLDIVDGHNHSAGQGVQIQPNGININSDLAFNSNNATLLRSSRFSPQNAVLNLATDIGCTYVVGNELYYNDVTGGNRFAITNNGSVNAGAGSIGGLPSGTASATFAAGTFVWQSATNTPANMDAGSYVYRNAAFNSKGLTLHPPAAMAIDFDLTLPSLPGSQSFMTVDVAGNMAGYASINQGIVRTNLAPVGQQVSASSAGFTTGSGVPAPVTNLSVTITTTGRPVMVFCQSVGDGTLGSFQSTGGAGQANWYLNRNIVATVLQQIFITNNGVLFPSAISFMDVVGAGTYTYFISSFVTAAAIANSLNLTLVAYEL